MKTVAVLALDGVMDSSLAITLDALRTAEAFCVRSGWTSAVRTVVVTHRKDVRTGGGMTLKADAALRDLADGTCRPDWLVIPGLGISAPENITPRLAMKDAVAAMEVLRAAKRIPKIAASCSSVFLLAESGVLAGRRATTTWWLAMAFRERFPDVKLDESKMTVRDGRFVTAGSAFAQLDLVLEVITDTLGPTIAHLCSRYLLIDQRPSQARYMIPSHVRQSDPTVVAAERWIDAHLAEPITVTDVAAAVAVSPKTLGRRILAATGASPVKFLQRRRVMQAANLIETTAMTVEAVAVSVGYQDGTALRRIIKRELGVTPARLRNRGQAM